MRLTTFALASLLLLPAVLQATDLAPDPSTEPSQTLSLETRQVDATTFLIVLSIDLEDIVAAIVRAPGETRGLTKIISDGATEPLLARPDLLQRGAMAGLKISLPTLQGKFNQRLPLDGTDLESIEVILVRADGTLLPSTFTSDSFAEGAKLTLSFDSEPETTDDL